MWVLISTAFVVAIALNVDARRGRTVTVICESGQELCGTRCYSPLTENCVDHKNGWGKQACKKEETLCGWDCVAPTSEKVCMDKDGRFDILCNPGEAACGASCYSPESQACFDDSLVCAKGQAACAGNCFDPSDNNQCLEGRYGSRVCETEEKICGSWGCYSSNDKVCFEEDDMLCDVGEVLCGRNCYNPSAGDTCHNEGTVCRGGTQLCGHECYDASSEDRVCLDNKKVCESGDSLCGDSNCYKISAGEQCFEARNDYHIVCAAGKNYCWYNCYDPKTDVCLNVENDDYRIVCPNGEAICKGKLSLNTWGTGCFNPNLQQCLEGQGGNVLCESGEVLCGNNCYTPGSTDKVCLESGILCQPGEESCGGKCYNPKNQTCFANVKSNIGWGG